MVDAENYIAPEARTYLEVLCKKVEAATGTKLFVVAPPRKALPNGDDLTDYLRDVKKRVGIDKSSVVINVGSNASPKQYKLHGVTRGGKVKEQYQFKLTSDQLDAVVSRFGTSDAVQRFNPQGEKWRGRPSPGFDKSVVLVAEQVGACIALARRRSTECNIQPLAEDRMGSGRCSSPSTCWRTARCEPGGPRCDGAAARRGGRPSGRGPARELSWRQHRRADFLVEEQVEWEERDRAAQ
ncbi:unnamed protein product [Prorocentrum cordatum]|uniref:Uncharacterized protein n=1 Tax=Prorocentrum cordatum TaxID=2364126 RepID=A0ABN9QPF1_9DINO|nr:unnamed protein product [Polarella glacialis]